MMKKTIKNRSIFNKAIAGSFLLSAILISIGTFFGASSAFAHEQKVSITQIFFNPVSGNIEIAHRLYLHDAEHAVQEVWGSADLISDPEDLKKLALYVRSNFILGAGKKIFSLTPIGTEIDGNYVWVYDEVKIPKKRIKALHIENYILRDVWREQSNLVNVEIGDFRKSEFFAGKDKVKKIMLKHNK